MSADQKTHAQRPWRRRPLLAGLAAAAAVVAVVAVVALSTPLLRAIGADLRGLFRSEQAAVVPMSPDNLGERLDDAALEALLSDQVRIESNGEPACMADPGRAAAAAGFHLRLPAILPLPDEITVQPAGRAAMRVDLARVRAVLRETAPAAAALPAAIDGAEITVDFTPSVHACWGDCPRPEAAAAAAAPGPGDDPDAPDPAHAPPRMSDGVLLIQLPSPAVTAPPGLPVDRTGPALLEIMGMPRAEAARFCANVDWATAFVIPIPRYSTSYQVVTVDGVPGALIRNTQRLTYMLIWTKDGMTYALAGSGEAARGIEIAGSLR
jgi:hypothetical protein